MSDTSAPKPTWVECPACDGEGRPEGNKFTFCDLCLGTGRTTEETARLYNEFIIGAEGDSDAE